MGVLKSQSGLPCRASTIFTRKPQPAEGDRGQRDDEDFLDQLTSQPSLRISQRGPQKPESLLGKRRKELHAHGVRRARDGAHSAPPKNTRVASIAPRTAKNSEWVMAR